MRHEFGTDARNEQQRTGEQRGRGQRRSPGMRQAEIQAFDVSVFDGFKGGIAAFHHAITHEN